MNIHFIAIGGAAMHNLALALKAKGYHVTGSDDEINEPSRSRLDKAGLLPAEMGWFPEKIHSGLDAVILGMHARAENPELLKAQELGVKVFSYPEYLYEQSKDKLRIVVGGSHGKTSITAMILHVLGVCKKDFDYMVGSQLAGFDTMVKVTADAPIMVLEGDEYLSSPIDRRPKFHLYKPDIALLSGIAWDHINVFPTFENYVEQFRIFVRQIPASGALIYCQEDEWVRSVSNDAVEGVKKLGYGIPANEIRDGITYLKTEIGEVPLQIFGDHNLMNLTGARLVCNQVGITDAEFYNAISSFKGAARRLEKIAESPKLIVFKDFAHSPSKLKATTEAVKAQYANRRVIACMELHTFSSLNSDFLAEYANSMNNPDVALVYYNPHTIAHKKLAPITPDQVKEAFGRKDLIVMNESSDVVNYLRDQVYDKAVLLLMSSGNFDGIDLNSFAKELADM
ncbi:MAG TPA: Mur ligase family protein [Bacteroidia bacterium]|jgi:UDP-N-acetylmuramate: L-alanyl-gamma-D-glutamyl-meso-diaminopimelate ligase|nr:Mur ligase family protein [Bacteroidia bacterium]